MRNTTTKIESTESIETPVEPTTPETPATQTPEPEITAELEVVDARVNIRGDEAPQSKYNVLVTDPASQQMLDRLAANLGFDAKNDKGQYYVACTSDARTANEFRRQGAGHKALLITGFLTIVDTDNGKPTGHITVCDANQRVAGHVRKASILDGGLMKQRGPAREVPTNNRVALGGGAASTGLRSQRTR